MSPPTFVKVTLHVVPGLAEHAVSPPVKAILTPTTLERLDRAAERLSTSAEAGMAEVSSFLNRSLKEGVPTDPTSTSHVNTCTSSRIHISASSKVMSFP
jgi:hypothetical protein